MKIKKERILKAASQCEKAKGVLTTLFPELFEKEKEEFDLRKMTNDQLFDIHNGIIGKSMCSTISKNHLHLSRGYDFDIVNSIGNKYLKITPKE